MSALATKYSQYVHAISGVIGEELRLAIRQHATPSKKTRETANELNEELRKLVAIQSDILKYLEMENPRNEDLEGALQKALQGQPIVDRITASCRLLGKDTCSTVREFLGATRAHHQMLQKLALLSTEKRGGRAKSGVIRRVFAHSQLDASSEKIRAIRETMRSLPTLEESALQLLPLLGQPIRLVKNTYELTVAQAALMQIFAKDEPGLGDLELARQYDKNVQTHTELLVANIFGSLGDKARASMAGMLLGEAAKLVHALLEDLAEEIETTHKKGLVQETSEEKGNKNDGKSSGLCSC